MHLFFSSFQFVSSPLLFSSIIYIIRHWSSTGCRRSPPIGLFCDFFHSFIVISLRITFNPSYRSNRNSNCLRTIVNLLVRMPNYFRSLTRLSGIVGGYNTGGKSTAGQD